MIKILLYLLGLITISPTAKAELNVYESIDVSATYFVEFWRNDSFLNKTRTPQIIRFASGDENTIWGGCGYEDENGEWIEYIQHFGSNYCSVTDTISLMSDEIEELYFDHGDAAPFYLVAHELAHALQARLGFTNKNMPVPKFELQADCFAGMFSREVVRDGNKLSINLEDIEEMSNAAWSGGDKPYFVSHGTPEQRRYAFRTGFYEGTCQPGDVEQIIALNPKQIRNSAYGSSISLLKNYKKSPYQKTFSDLTPMVGIQPPKRLPKKSLSKEFSFIHDLLENWKSFKMKLKEVNRIISN